MPEVEEHISGSKTHPYFLGKSRDLEMKAECTDHITEQGLSPSTGPKLAERAGPGNGWGPRLRSPGPVAFEDRTPSTQQRGARREKLARLSEHTAEWDCPVCGLQAWIVLAHLAPFKTFSPQHTKCPKQGNMGREGSAHFKDPKPRS